MNGCSPVPRSLKPNGRLTDVLLALRRPYVLVVLVPVRPNESEAAMTEIGSAQHYKDLWVACRNELDHLQRLWVRERDSLNDSSTKLAALLEERDQAVALFEERFHGEDAHPDPDLPEKLSLAQMMLIAFGKGHELANVVARAQAERGNG